MHIPSMKELVTPEEWQLRCDLAACYRLVALYGMSDLVFTHISAKLPASVTGGEEQFLINPYGLLFDEITASSLVKVDMACNKLHESPFPVNPAGFTIHSAVHAARPDVACVLHTHTRAGVAVSAQQAGVLPISSKAPSCWPRWPTTTTKAWPSATRKSRACKPTWAAPTSWSCATTGC